MKVKGRKLEANFEELVPISRPDYQVPRMEDGKPVMDGEKPVMDTVSGDFVFVVKPVLSYSGFEQLCPVPEPPEKLVRGDKVKDVENKDYKRKIEEWYELRTAWMLIESIRYTPDLEFEQVKFDDPQSWKLLDAEMDEAGFLPTERGRLMTAILNVNSLNIDKIDKAREAFLSARQQAKG